MLGEQRRWFLAEAAVGAAVARPGKPAPCRIAAQRENAVNPGSDYTESVELIKSTGAVDNIARIPSALTKWPRGADQCIKH
jgi:hypothetical protein